MARLSRFGEWQKGLRRSLYAGRICAVLRAVLRIDPNTLALAALVSLNCFAAGPTTQPELNHNKAIEVVVADVAPDVGVATVTCNALSDWGRNLVELLPPLTIDGEPVIRDDREQSDDEGGTCSPVHASFYIAFTMALATLGAWLGSALARPQVRRIRARRKKWCEDHGIPFVE